jgi:general secretion pathway protein C
MYKHLFTLLNLLIIGTMVYFGVSTFFVATSARLDTAPDAPPPPKSPKQTERIQKSPLTAYSSIYDRDLFDTKATVEEVPKTVDVEALEQTSLQLKLWGTVTGPPEEAYAVIEEGGKREQNLFRVGDAIQNATVKLILREKIILNVEGKDEILEIEKAVGKGSAPARAFPGRPTPGRPAAQTPISVQKITLRRNQIDSAIQDVSQLMNQVNIRPHFYQGQPDGMMLSRIKPNSIFMRMGLRNGDVITGVNGRDITTVDDALGFYENLKSTENVKLNIKRGGRQRTIEYSIK